MAKEAEVAVAKKVDLQQLHQATHQKISFAKEKTSISEREVYLIAKEFFKDLLELNYEFTHDELIEELRKTYLDKESFAKLENFILVIGQMEYSKKKFSQEELKILLEEMKTIVDHLIKHHQRKKTFFEKLFGLSKKKTIKYETAALEKLEEEIEAEEEIVDQELIESLRELIREAIREKNNKKAKTIYLECKKMYEVLGNAEKKHIYPELLAASEELRKRTTNAETAQEYEEITPKQEETITNTEKTTEEHQEPTQEDILGESEADTAEAMMQEEIEQEEIASPPEETTPAKKTKKSSKKKTKKGGKKESKKETEEKKQEEAPVQQVPEEIIQQATSATEDINKETKIAEELMQEPDSNKKQDEPKYEQQEPKNYLQDPQTTEKEQNLVTATASNKKEPDWTTDHEELIPDKKETSAFTQDVDSQDIANLKKSEQKPEDVNELVPRPKK